jgi:hypothetical protein
MRFKQYLLLEYSKSVANEIDLIYQKLLDNLDNGHVDSSEETNELSFNMGKIMKDSAYNNLVFMIRAGQTPAVRLGKQKESGKSMIVVDKSGKLPTREKLMAFLESTKYADRIKKSIKRYLERHHEFNSEVDPATNYEKKKATNADFEGGYDKLVKAIDKKLKTYGDAKGQLKIDHDKSANLAKREIVQAAMRSLFDEEFGGTFEAFKSIALKLPEAAFVKQLDGEQKNKVMARLESYYEHRSEELVDDEPKAKGASKGGKEPAEKKEPPATDE